MLGVTILMIVIMIIFLFKLRFLHIAWLLTIHSIILFLARFFWEKQDLWKALFDSFDIFPFLIFAYYIWKHYDRKKDNKESES